MAQQWYVRIGDTVGGPYSCRQLRVLASKGDISQADFFREGDTGPWSSGSKLRGLFDPIPAEEPARSAHSSQPIEQPVEQPSVRQETPLSKPPRTVAYVLFALLLVSVLFAVRQLPQSLPSEQPLVLATDRSESQSRTQDARSDQIEKLKLQVETLERKVQATSREDLNDSKPAPIPTPELMSTVSDRGSGKKQELPQLLRNIEPAVVSVECVTAQGSNFGSGFIQAEEKIVVTNLHVIAGASSASIIFADGTRLPVRGASSASPETDLAILDVLLPSSYSTGLSLAPVICSKGEAVIAIGSPRGLKSSATDGIVSAVRSGAEVIASLQIDEWYRARGLGDGTTWLQTSAPISPGNSGGPLLNYAGQVVGVNTWCHDPGSDLNFAVSAVHIRDLVDRRSTDTLPLANFPALPAAVAAVPHDLPNDRDPKVGEDRLKQLRSIYEQRVVLLARREILDAKILEVRTAIESSQAELTGLASQAAGIASRAALLNQELERLSAEKLFVRDPAALQTYDLAIERRRAELRSLVGEASAVNANAASSQQRLSDLNRQMFDADRSSQQLWNEQRSLRNEFLSLADPFGKLARGDHEAGIVALSEWIALDTSNPDAYFARALAYAHLDRTPEAFQDLQQAAEFESTPSGELIAARGWLQVKNGDTKAGETNLRRALGIDRTNATVYLFRGMAALLDDRENAAIKEFRDAIRVDPQCAEAHRQLGWLLATAKNEKLRKGKPAIAAAKKACELTRFRDASCVQALAAAHAAAGEFAEAVTRANEAILLLPTGMEIGLASQKKSYEQQQPWVRAN